MHNLIKAFHPLFLLLIFNSFTYADNLYSEQEAYDLVADGFCKEAKALITEEKDQISFRLSSSKLSEGNQILSNIGSACSYIHTAQEYLEKVKKCTEFCPAEDIYKVGPGYDKLFYEGLKVRKDGSPKLKKLIKQLDKDVELAEEMVKWKDYGYWGNDEIKLFQDNKISLDSALAWHAGTRDKSKLNGDKQQFSAQDMINWKKENFPLYDVQKLKSLGISFELYISKKFRFQKLKKQGNNIDEIADWLKCELPDDEIDVWIGVALSCKDAQDWIVENINLEDAKKWSNLASNAAEAIAFRQSGMTIEEAQAWSSAGFDAEDSKKWISMKVSVEEAKKWRDIDLTPDLAAEWEKNGFTIKSPEVALWASLEISPSDAKLWIKNKIDASEYLFFVNLGYNTPKKASAILKSVRRKCKIAQNKYVADNVNFIEEIGNENPYETKGKCYVGKLAFSKLKGRNEGYFVNTDGDPILVKTNQSTPINGFIFGYFISRGAIVYKNGLGVETILPNLEAIFLESLQH